MLPWQTLDRAEAALNGLDCTLEQMSTMERIAYADALTSYLTAWAALVAGRQAGWLPSREAESRGSRL